MKDAHHVRGSRSLTVACLTLVFPLHAKSAHEDGYGSASG